MTETDTMLINQVASEPSAEVKDQATIPEASGSEALNREQLQIINWLKEVRFRKQLFGGVNEQDVWKKIEKLNEMYEAALKAERIRYDVLLEQQSKVSKSSIQSGNLTKDKKADE